MSRQYKLNRLGSSIDDDAWLNLGDLNGVDIINPMLDIDQEYIDNPGLLELKIMRDPNFLGFAAKALLDIDLMPFQCAILQELWIRPFPMLIMSRGGGKSFLLAVYATLKCILVPGTKIVGVGAAFRQSKVIFEYMEKIWANAPILRSVCTSSSGPYKNMDRCIMQINDSTATFIPIGDGCCTKDTFVTYKDGFGTIDRYGDISKIREQYLWDGKSFMLSDECYYNGIKPVKRITTKRGYSFAGTYNHKLKILRNNKIIFARLDEMKINDYLVIDRSERWHDGQFKCTIDQAYALGAMIGDGCWTNKYYLRFTSKDPEIVNNVENGLNIKFIKCSDNVHYNYNSLQYVNNWLKFWNLEVSYAKDKKLPNTILSSSQENMTACLQGCFDTDGHVCVSTKKGGTSLSIGFTNTSKELVKQIQFILSHYGIISNVSSRERKKEWNTVYELLITGKDAVKFVNKIGFRLSRKQDIAISAIKAKVVHRSSEDIIPNIQPILSKYKGFAKAKFRKNITHDIANEFLDKFGSLDTYEINNLKQICNENYYYDKITTIIDENDQKTYDLHVPYNHTYIANCFISHNSKIRGLRADTIIADEFASISPSIYETVIRGFAAVSAKPLDGVKAHARKQSMKKRGVWNNEEEKIFQSIKSNQCVITGTADYDFMHYADYWKKYMVFIRSEGKLDKQVRLPSGETKTLRDYFPDGIEEGFDHKDYSVIRIPYSLIPKGYMDDKVVSAAKSGTHKAIYDKEYGAVFPSDSDGFFRRSLIESCVTSKENPIQLSSGQKVWFDSTLTGTPNMEYVYGIDPAAENDNLTIVILEMHADHTRIVYGWSTNIRDFQKRKSAGMVEDHDYYGFCARKVRNLMRVFPTSNIAMDAQGGGRAILEAFHDPDRLQPGEHFLWPTNKVLNPDKELPTDIEAGLHIIHMCQFANTDFTYMANHGTKKDFESKVLLFPRFDPVTLEISAHKDEETAQRLGVRSLYDTLEDCVMEIEDLKDELCTIVMTRTSQSSQARDRWDTPETTNTEGKKGRMRKDRYSALIMANFIARSIQRAPADIGYGVIGGLAHQIAAKRNLENRRRNDLYVGPDWYTSGMTKNCIAVVKKGV